jgi:PAS domain S-box-containing protein
MKKAKILIVEDEAIIAMEIESQLQSLGYEVTSIVDTGEKAIEKAEKDKPDLILMDIRIKGKMDGIDTAETIRNKYGIPVIFSTAYLDQERIERAKITMPFGYVLKPIQERDLKVTFEMALYVAQNDIERKRMEDLLRIQRDLGINLGRSMNFQEMLRLCLKAALEVSKMDCGGIYIVDNATKSFHLAYHGGLSKEFIATVSHFKASSQQAQMVTAGKPTYANHNQLGVILTKVEQNENLKSMAIIPVKHKNQVVGCLNVASHTFEEIPLFVRNTLETIVTQIGDAIAKKQIEKTLIDGEKRFRTIFNKSFQFALILNTEGTIIEMNDLCYEICGRLAEESMGKSFEDALWWSEYPDVKQRTRSAIKKTQNGDVVTDEVVFIDKNMCEHTGVDRQIIWIKSSDYMAA